MGYVITRPAAKHFLRTTTRMVHGVDHALFRFWESGLNVYYVDTPVVFHGGEHDSFIEPDRQVARRMRDEEDGPALTAWRRIRASVPRAIRRRRAFGRLLRGETGVTHW